MFGAFDHKDEKKQTPLIALVSQPSNTEQWLVG